MSNRDPFYNTSRNSSTISKLTVKDLTVTGTANLPGGTGISGPVTSAVNDIVTWNSVDGTIVKDSGALLTTDVAKSAIAMPTSAILANNSTYLGYYAGLAATATAASNTCVGAFAGATTTTGNSLTAVGSLAGSSFGGTSALNTCVGVQAGNSATGVCFQNVFLGNHAGGHTNCQNATGIGSFSSCLANDTVTIGAGAQTFAVATGGIAIGSSAVTKHLNSIAIGQNATTTQVSQMVLGSGLSEIVSSVGSVTNLGSFTTRFNICYTNSIDTNVLNSNSLIYKLLPVANSLSGTFTMSLGSGGAITTAVQNNVLFKSKIILTRSSAPGVAAAQIYVSGIFNGIGFDVSSTSASDSGDIDWVIIQQQIL